MYASDLNIQLIEAPLRRQPKVLHPFCGNGTISPDLIRLAPLIHIGIEPQKPLYQQALPRLNYVINKNPFALESDPLPGIQCLLLTPGPYHAAELLDYLHSWIQPGALCLFFIQPQAATQEFSRWCMTHLLDPALFSIQSAHLHHTVGIIAQFSGTPLDPSGRIQTFFKELKQSKIHSKSALGKYTIPPPIHNDLHIFPKLVDQAELLGLLRTSSLWNHPGLQREIAPPPPTAAHPLMPVKPCHLALQIAAGVLNGQEVVYQSKPLLIKGRTIKKEHAWKEEELSLDGILIDVERSTENYSTIVHALDLQEGTLYAISN